ncbi:hypothetical protein [Candidatus Spyradosoma sp. SGI.093]|uniref:hypothetical protein n=1 Tax=Candidatus Spyradosoma sp. SGI.093 TaxID=3420583 RepID=UPI003D09178B
MKHQISHSLFALAGALSAGLCVFAGEGVETNAFPPTMGCGTVERARAVTDPDTGSVSIVVEDFYTICERVERLAFDEDGNAVIEVLNKYGTPFGADEDVAPYVYSDFPALADFYSSISVSYTGTVPETLSGWEETWAILNTQGEDENYFYRYASYSSGFSGSAPYHTYPFSCTATFTLNCEGVDQIAVSVSSDDDASVEVLGQKCESSLFSPGSMTIEVPEGTNSFPVTVIYENIGGPYSLNFSVELRKRL